MSKYKCHCGFDDGTDEGVTAHMWSEYAKLQRDLREGKITLAQFRQKQRDDHFASWLN